ncbi:rhomboid family intramembrane serine protease [Nocardioides jiangxiensis]|uniref:Rhomboid family intramembrane serine protease n=1 Tax=Nocardioides jiangxiensis TaxID=3064524 RepID=A0ABT9B0A2_9ACTN|nr:rhomboid family intramembrane serine protease [Nocardioides sp. WY-20]MDO7868272.1 rhomboid family intramembrane serine protease [Nocardioides sp. WY-20]
MTPAPQCYRHAGRETHISCQRCGRPICPDCMRSAAVGFQCPDCVRSGARETRSGRTAYGGARVANPGLTSGVLIAINAAVWALITATGGAASRWVDWLALRPEGICARGQYAWPSATRADCADLGSWLPGVADGAWWQLVTSMFTHIDVTHIGFNMLALWVLGPQLELALGRARFLALYLLSGLGGSLAVYWLAPSYTPTLGASGAIFGLMAALLVLALKVGGDVRNILMWIGINAAITVVGRGSISWQGHLGGFLGGLALMGLLAFSPKGPQRARWQWTGVVVYAALVLAGCVLRTVALA